MEVKLTDEQVKEIFKGMTYDEINKLRDEILAVKEEDVKPLYKTGDILATDNGDFLIVKFSVNEPQLFGYGAMYLGYEMDENEFDIQYMNVNFDELIKEIEEDGRIRNSKEARISY